MVKVTGPSLTRRTHSPSRATSAVCSAIVPESVSLAMAPAMMLAGQARFIDLDGPRILQRVLGILVRHHGVVRGMVTVLRDGEVHMEEDRTLLDDLPLRLERFIGAVRLP